MSNQHPPLRHRLLAVCALAALLPAVAGAQTQDPREALRAAIGNQLKPMLGDSAAPLVERLLTIKIDGAISRNFDVGKVTSALFGRTAANVAPDCRSTQTPAREADTGLCVIDAGNRESETGAYQMLAFSKNIGLGDVMFARRAAFSPDTTSLPVAAKLSDADAYSQAVNFLLLMGVPKSEIPVPPQGAKNALPVRSLMVGAEDQKGGTSTRVVMHKVVSLPRAFVVPGGLLKDPTTGQVLNHVIAPGGATLNISDRGVQFARIDGWSDAQLDPKLDPRRAKSTTDLVNEIADDLYGEGVRKVGALSILIALRKATPNPDDPNPPLCPACGVLRPALRVLVSQAGNGAVVSSERAHVAPGLVREYDLVAQNEAGQPSR
jgi:hypothetical protein